MKVQMKNENCMCIRVLSDETMTIAMAPYFTEASCRLMQANTLGMNALMSMPEKHHGSWRARIPSKWSVCTGDAIQQQDRYDSGSEMQNHEHTYTRTFMQTQVQVQRGIVVVVLTAVVIDVRGEVVVDKSRNICRCPVQS